MQGLWLPFIHFRKYIVCTTYILKGSKKSGSKEVFHEFLLLTPWKCELSPGRHETTIKELGQAKKFWQKLKQTLIKHYLCEPLLLQTLHLLPSEHPFSCPAIKHIPVIRKEREEQLFCLKLATRKWQSWDLNPGNMHHSACFSPKRDSQECANNIQDRCKTYASFL